MQSLLVLVFAAAVGLAALVTRHVRLSMRVELAPATTRGRLLARLPAKWAAAPIAMEKGDGIEADEPPTELAPGRRLRIMRQRGDGLISPLEHLVRSGQIKSEVLKSLADGREGYSLTNLTVAGWPGQMLTMEASTRPGVLSKDVLACAVLPGSAAVVIQLEGTGPLDASDRELVRQMSENVSLAMQGSAGESGGTVRLVDDISVDAPPGYLIVPNDDVNQLGRQLLFDGSKGAAWVVIDLAPCVFSPGDGDVEFLTMLNARDPEWRGGPVRRLSPRTLAVDRIDALGRDFPSRAYLIANDAGQALLVVMRAGPRGRVMFDSAWRAIWNSTRFNGKRDFAGLLANGAEAARRAAADGRWLPEKNDSRNWFMWDASENAGQELWSQSSWTVVADRGEISGKRTVGPTDPYLADTQFEQQWSASADGSKYQIATYREARRAGNQFPRQTLEQRVVMDHGRLNLASALGPGIGDAAAPAGFVPGALLPFMLRELAEKPALVKTESFVGINVLAPPGLLTLFITRLADAPTRLDENGDPMDCVTVSVNGTGRASRWYFSADHALRFIDFAGSIKAQSGEAVKKSKPEAQDPPED